MKRKPKILLLSDDIRLPSGVGTVSMNLVTRTLAQYQWVQIAGALTHPEAGKRIDMSQQLQQQTGVPGAYCVLYPTTGYGDQNLLRQVIHIEKPDLIIHFTDPRFWDWLYQMEHEIRQHIPIAYLTIWDDLPYPRWNENAYESCDLLMAINRQTYNIVKQVRQRKPVKPWELTYVPHGIDDKIFRPINAWADEYTDLRKRFLGEKLAESRPNFIFGFNARNIQRKRIMDMLWAFHELIQTGEDAHFLLHCPRVDSAGTDLTAFIRDLMPKSTQDRIVFYEKHDISPDHLNVLYNLFDTTVLTSSAEGFGLSCAESIMSGTPVLVNVVGGLQDQVGLRWKHDHQLVKLSDYNNETPTFSNRSNDVESGEWTFTVFPESGFQGSPQTPYIYDSKANIADIIVQMQKAVSSKENLTQYGILGRQYLLDNGFSIDGMIDAFKKSITGLLENWKPRSRWELVTCDSEIVEYTDNGALVWNK